MLVVVVDDMRWRVLARTSVLGTRRRSRRPPRAPSPAQFTSNGWEVSATRGEEATQQLAALDREQTDGHLRAMVQTRLAQPGDGAAARARLRIARAEHDARDAR